MDSDVSVYEDDAVLLEFGESSEEEGSDLENDDILQPRNSRNRRPCTTYLTRHFHGKEKGRLMIRYLLSSIEDAPCLTGMRGWITYFCSKI